MNVSPFYELRKRLYNSAAAGCSNVKEDFRLKKALEEFSPLAQANKTFARLGDMCGKLFDSEDPAPLLADCIALADALSVAQGTFSDPSETEVSAFPKLSYDNNAPYSRVSELCRKVKAASPKLEDPSAEEIKLAADPRVISAFVSVSNQNSWYLSRFFEYIVRSSGDSVVPLLRKKIDLSDPKESGARVRYIAAAAGEAENDLYVSIAENADAPQNVRIAAIEAMGFSEDNKEKLIELYNTEKGKVKNAALLALAGIDCPECEEIFTKLTAKYKKTYDQYVARSGGKVCTAFAVNLVKEELSGNVSGKNTNERRGYREHCNLLANKPDADEGFLALKQPENSYMFLINGTLIENILVNRSRMSEFEELIHRLYKAERKVFSIAEFFVRLMHSPDTVFEDMKSDIDPIPLLKMLDEITYDSLSESYCFRSIIAPTEHYSRLSLFKDIPDSVLDFLGKASKREENLYKARIFEKFLESYGNPSDFERIRKKACEFSVSISHTAPVRYSVQILDRYGDKAMPELYRGMLTDYVLKSVEDMTYDINITEVFPLSSADRVSEFEDILKKLKKKQANPLSDSRKKYYIERYIAIIEEYISSHKL